MQTSNGDIELRTGPSGTLRVTVSNNGSPALEIAGNCNVTAGHTYEINGVPIATVSGSPIDLEEPTGPKNGSNPTFNLASPVAGSSVHLYMNGVLQTINNDYTILGQVITMLAGAIPQTGYILRASYRTP